MHKKRAILRPLTAEEAFSVVTAYRSASTCRKWRQRAKEGEKGRFGSSGLMDLNKWVGKCLKVVHSHMRGQKFSF